MESTMLAQVKLCACAALVTITIVGPSYAQTLEQSYDDPMLPVIEIAKQSHEFSGIEYPASAAAKSLTGRTRYMEAMLTEIATWLSTNLDLPAIQDRPRIEFASPMKLASMRYTGIFRPMARGHLERSHHAGCTDARGHT